MSIPGDILIKGARQHNLRNLELRLPRGKFIVFTGVSGSGKTSLVFDTIYAEGQRQYMESLSARSRQWLDQMDRPDVDFIQGLSPVIAVEQRTTGGASPRSTVATVTETADYARLLWSLAGEQFCPKDGGRIVRRSLDDCLARIHALPEGTRLILLAPFMRARPAVLRDELPRLQLRGFQRVRIGGVIKQLDASDLYPPGRDEVDVEIVIDRLVRREDQNSRLADSLELAFREGRNRAVVLAEDTSIPLGLDFSCETCGTAYEQLSPRHFSHNHPDGACPACGGLGKTLQFQPALVIPDPALPLNAGAVKPWRLGSKRMISARNSLLRQLSSQVPFALETSWEKLDPAVQRLLLHGDPSREFALKPYGKQKSVSGPFGGILADLAETARTTSSDSLRARLLTYQTATLCPECRGRRVNARALAVKLNGLGLADFLALPVVRASEFAETLARVPGVAPAEDARRGLAERLGFLVKTGLGYLTLDREFGTLSGGEIQRVRLATQLGLALVGVTYILDEPSIGLHPADHKRLLDTLLDLRDRGNTLLVVEHDEDTIRAADQIVEIGSGAGKQGGALVFQGTPAEAAAGGQSTFPADSALAAAEAEVARATMPRIATTKQAALAAVETAGFAGRELTNKNDGVKGRVSKSSLNKMFSGKAVQQSANTAAHYNAAANVEHLFENAVLALTHRDTKTEGRISHIKFIHRYLAPMLFRGDAYCVKITLKEYTGETENKIYSVEAMSVSKIKESVARTDSQTEGHSGQFVERSGAIPPVASPTPIDNLGAEVAAATVVVNPLTPVAKIKESAAQADSQCADHSGQPADDARTTSLVARPTPIDDLSGKIPQTIARVNQAIALLKARAAAPSAPAPAATSRTGDYLSGRASIEKNARTLAPGTRWLTVANAAENNLRTVTARFPVGLFTVVCGVSGSGKSTLVNDILANTAARKINGAKTIPGRHGGITGLEHFTSFVRVDQDAAGKSARSNPATFTGIFDELRKLYAAAPLAKIRGYGPTRFSFNVRGGRCERCGGDGRIALDMQFLGETYVTCPGCHGVRYNRETLEVRYRSRNIAEVLALTVSEAREFFRHHTKLKAKLETLDEVGLGYLQLGQPASTLSGGEAQRLKLSLELSRRQQGETLYILDEPTTGLHWDDIQRLLDLLLRLRDAGNTVVVIEHHRDMVRHADWLLELGPGGGDLGGNLLFEGTPAQLRHRTDTPTARFL